MALVLFLMARAYAEVPDGGPPAVEWSGYLKTFLIGVFPARVLTPGGAIEDPALGSADEGLRLRCLAHLADGLDWTVAYEWVPTVQRTGTFLTRDLLQAAPGAYRVADLDARLYPRPGDAAEDLTVRQNLDRFFWQWSAGWGDVIFGRQPIAFGSARVIDPTDVLTPFAFQALDKEERPGIDALRVRIPMGEMGEFDAGWVMGRDLRTDLSAFYLKPRLYWLGTDITLLAMRFQDLGLAGLDLARAVGGASAWLEAAYVLARMFGREEGPDYLRLSAGVDYNLFDGGYGFLEYHFNGAGAERPVVYPSLASRAAYRSGAVFLFGRHYLSPGLTWQVSALHSASIQILVNVQDGSCFAAPGWTYSFADNVVLQAGAMLSFGRAASADEPRSEFGAYPRIVYSAGKLYF